MTSSNGNIFRVTGPLCGEFTGPGEFPAQRPVTRSFDVFFDMRPNKWLSKQPWGWWFETPSWSLWRQCNGHNLQNVDHFVHASICQIRSTFQYTSPRPKVHWVQSASDGCWMHRAPYCYVIPSCQINWLISYSIVLCSFPNLIYVLRFLIWHAAFQRSNKILWKYSKGATLSAFNLLYLMALWYLARLLMNNA